MSNDTNTPETDSEPIDADFEPAPARTLTQLVGKDGPGWLAFGILGGGTVGALALAFGAFAGNTSNDYAPASLASDINELAEAQRSTEDRLAAMASNASDAETRLQREMQALLSGDDDTEGLESLVADLNTVSERLDNAMTGGVDNETLNALIARIQTLEEADDGEAVSPRQMNRAVTAMRERVKTLEETNQELVSALEIRGEAIAGLTTRIAEMEIAFRNTGESGGLPVTSESVGDISQLQNVIDMLSEDVAQLQAGAEQSETDSLERYEGWLTELRRTGVLAEASNDDARADIDAASRNAAAALALSSIEAAARRGRSFRSAYARLNGAMPGEPAVLALEELAETGAPTLSDLRARFVSDRGKALATDDETKRDGWGWVRTVFGDGVKVRRSGDEETGVAARLESAEAGLQSDDLATAIEAVEGLHGEAAEAMEDWLVDARKRAALEDGLDRLRLKMIGTER